MHTSVKSILDKIKFISLQIFVAFILFIPNVISACHNSTINSVNSVNNGNGTTTYTINVSIDVGGSDGYSYGFALIFNGGCPAPVVQNGFTPTVTRPSYNPLTGYTGANIGTGGATGYFSLRYANQTNVLTYESNDAAWGFGSTDYNNNNIVVTLAGCVSSIVLDADIRSLTPTNAANTACVKTYNTGETCSSGGAPTTSFSYTTPVCANAANPSPTTVAGFTTGGTYSSAAGLSINASTGAINLAASTPATYTVTYAVAALGCTTAGSSIASITINQSPSAPTISQVDSVCVGSSNSIGVINPIAGQTYNWNLSGGSITSGTGTSNISSIWTGSGLGTISVSASNNCGTSPVTTKSVVIVNATINPPNVITICIGQSANINVSGNASGYSWSPIIGLSNPSITNPVASPTVRMAAGFKKLT